MSDNVSASSLSLCLRQAKFEGQEFLNVFGAALSVLWVPLNGLPFSTSDYTFSLRNLSGSD